MTLAGYLLGEIPWFKENIEKVALGIIFISITPMIFQFIKAYLNKRKSKNT
jgi:membrane-associated protein